MPTILASASNSLSLTAKASRQVNVSLLTFLFLSQSPIPTDLDQHLANALAIQVHSARTTIVSANNTLSLSASARRTVAAPAHVTLNLTPQVATPNVTIIESDLTIFDSLQADVPREAEWHLCLNTTASANFSFVRSLESILTLEVDAVAWTGNSAGAPPDNGPMDGSGDIDASLLTTLLILDALASNYNYPDTTLNLEVSLTAQIDRCQ